MAEQGEPFAFCGRIVEAYYSNPELDTVAILWSDGEKNREYYVVAVSYTHLTLQTNREV